MLWFVEPPCISQDLWFRRLPWRQPTLWPRAAQSDDPAASSRPVAAVFLTSLNTNEIWPYPGFDTRARQVQVMAALQQGCPDVEFLPVTVGNPADVSGISSLLDQVQGLLVYVMTLDWVQSETVAALGKFGKPMLVVDEFLGGSGAFLIACSGLPGAVCRLPVYPLRDWKTSRRSARVFGELADPDGDRGAVRRVRGRRLSRRHSRAGTTAAAARIACS